MGSLKFRLALASALLIALSVGVTVAHSVREVELRTESVIIGSNLGAAELAATLSENVSERQRALEAAARAWPRGQVADTAHVESFLGHQTVLLALFDKILIEPKGGLSIGHWSASLVAPPVTSEVELDAQDIAMSISLPSSEPDPPVLIGKLKLRSSNYLSRIAKAAQLDDLHVQTIVANQQGHILAHADDKWLLSVIDVYPSLEQATAQWRRQGSPLEAHAWTERFGNQFVAMAAVPGTDWMLFRLGSHEALKNEANQTLIRIIGLGASVGLIGALTIFGLMAWLLGPLDTLRRRSLLALDPAQPPQLDWPETGGEIGELSRVLRYVSEQLALSQTEMQQSLQRMRSVLVYAPVGIGFTTEDRFELASSQLESMLGYEPGGLDCPWSALLAPEAPRQELQEAAEAAFRAGKSFEAEVPLLRSDGSTLWVQVHGAAVFGDKRRTIWIVSDATDSRRQLQDLTWNATHDSLTELINRREFERLLSLLLLERRRHDVASALFIDLDHFKQVNDGAGHAEGDLVLKAVAQVLREGVRSEDSVARLGGDEFAVLLPRCAIVQALKIAEQLRESIAKQGVCKSNPSLGVTASIGVVEIEVHHQTLEEVLDAADRACYAAKRKGRNAVCSATVPIHG